MRPGAELPVSARAPPPVHGSSGAYGKFSNVHDCTCDDKSSPSSCNSGKSWERPAACAWTNCNSITSSIDGDNLTYNFNLSSLNLNPMNGTITYEFRNDGWSNTANGTQDPLLLLSDTQLGVLNCLQDQLNIRYIGVNNKGSMWYDYQVLVGADPGKKGVDLYFYDDTSDDYNLSIHETSTLIHDVNYSSKKPTIIHLIGYI